MVVRQSFVRLLCLKNRYISKNLKLEGHISALFKHNTTLDIDLVLKYSAMFSAVGLADALFKYVFYSDCTEFLILFDQAQVQD